MKTRGLIAEMKLPSSFKLLFTLYLLTVTPLVLAGHVPVAAFISFLFPINSILILHTIRNRNK